MNTKVIRKWVDALRSGKYKQSAGRLRKDDMFCATGVLCDLHSNVSRKYAWGTDACGNPISGALTMHYTFYGGEIYDAPESVKKWVGLSGMSITKVSAMNDGPIFGDGKSHSFDEIADYLERTYLKQS